MAYTEIVITRFGDHLVSMLLNCLLYTSYAATGGLWVRKNEEEEEERVKIGLSLDDIEKDRISDYMAAFYSISFFLKSQGVIQEIYYGEHKYLLCHIEQYEELFTDIFCGKYELSSDPMEHLYKIPLCEKGQDLSLIHILDQTAIHVMEHLEPWQWEKVDQSL